MLFPTDFSEPADRLLECLDELRPLGFQQVVLVHVTDVRHAVNLLGFDSTYYYAAALAIPTYLTGEPAEEAIEHLPGVVEDLIETHEERALIALILTIFGGILGLASLWTAYAWGQTPRLLALATLLVVLVGAGTMAWTGNAGGKIRDPEIRAATTPAAGGAELEERAGRED
ncbi:MAG: hypothetical protein HYY20_02535 [Candidatus Tectomicrobia bacterium]|uniref:Uncharacterized protein n=1 Tax=Tectimicrobiota bacterium TaxID=2528274 RepID=A0A932FZU4_UNCTE|nr:hypothetical protein [Candidatus Tectomicrobia bacterium]